MASSPPAARVAGTDFRPPRPHPPTLRLFQTLLPGLLRRFCGVVAVDIPAPPTFYDAYRADKRSTVARMTHELEAAVQELLDAGKHPPKS